MSATLSMVKEATANAFDYDAFISYKRSDGTRAARWLRRKLLGYRLPRALRDRWPRKLSVYLDTVYERATDDFFENNVKLALIQSRHLVVVVSPALLDVAPGTRFPRHHHGGARHLP